MMHGREKSDSAIVAVKPTNKVVSATAEPVEPRAGAKGNASQQSTLRTQCRKCVSQALERIRQVRRHSPKVGAVCGNSARTDLGGGRSVMTVPTALRVELFRFGPRRGQARGIDSCGQPNNPRQSGKLSLRYPIRRGDVGAWFRLSVGG